MTFETDARRIVHRICVDIDCDQCWDWKDDFEHVIAALVELYEKPVNGQVIISHANWQKILSKIVHLEAALKEAEQTIDFLEVDALEVGEY